MVQAVSLRDKEIDDRRGKFEILGCRGIYRGTCRRTRRRRGSAGAMLRQPDPIHRVHLLELVLAQEIQDRASSVALHRLRSDALHVDVARQRSRAQQVSLARK